MYGACGVFKAVALRAPNLFKEYQFAMRIQINNCSYIGVKVRSGYRMIVVVRDLKRLGEWELDSRGVPNLVVIFLIYVEEK